MPETVSIGQLRWPVVVARRVQTPDPVRTGIAETLQHVLATRARIDPVGPVTYYGAAAVDTPFTHKVWIRYVPWLDTRHVILRATENPDGSYNTDLFRIRRWSAWQGRQRFLFLEVEEERRVETELDPVGPDAPRSPGALDLYDAADPGLEPAVPGAGGAPSPAVPPALPLVFRFPVPQAVWVLPHSLGRVPDAEAYAPDGTRLYPDERAGEQTTTLTFNPPQAGVAYVE